MGWASGSSLFGAVWASVRPHIPTVNRVDVCRQVMESFADEDCDTLSECICQEWPEVEEAYDLIYGDDE